MWGVEIEVNTCRPGQALLAHNAPRHIITRISPDVNYRQSGQELLTHSAPPLVCETEALVQAFVVIEGYGLSPLIRW